ncbi:hypothetical protein Scep_021787 [Stephania cephalantha]|uniref:Uncharacterized protein n=1 Tax=Stephania cephalantha TaxID=152367 RepID=A0AAP0F967_9MAGN
MGISRPCGPTLLRNKLRTPIENLMPCRKRSIAPRCSLAYVLQDQPPKLVHNKLLSLHLHLSNCPRDMYRALSHFFGECSSWCLNLLEESMRFGKSWESLGRKETSRRQVGVLTQMNIAGSHPNTSPRGKKKTYEEKWIPTYVKDHFWGSMSTTQRNEKH